MNSIFAFRKKYIGIALICMSAIILAAFGLFYINQMKGKLPGNIYVVCDEETTIDLDVPATGVCETVSDSVVVSNIDFSKPVTFTGNTIGNYTLKIKLFNIFDIKTVNVNVVDNKYVYPGGMQIGMYLKIDGVLVADIGTIVDENGVEVSPCKNVFCKGDYIVDVDGTEISSKKILNDMVKNSDGNAMKFKVKRNGELVDLEVSPIKTQDGTCKIGLWIKDDSQGIGTLTFITEENNFAALGHGISDESSDELLDISGGQIYRTRIVAIVKGENGAPGELMGTINYTDTNMIGKISANTESGLFGTFRNSAVADYKIEAMEVGYSQDIKKGPAYIRMYEDGQCKDYEIDIYNINMGSSKNLTFRVVSQELLDKTNGIVQGMSGSPIIQNDKIVGAVTHVFVDDSKKGYGIFIENMLNYGN